VSINQTLALTAAAERAAAAAVLMLLSTLAFSFSGSSLAAVTAADSSESLSPRD